MRYFFVALWIVTASLIPAGVFGFRDTEHHFFRSSIDALAASGIVSGYDGEIFGPQNPLTRSELLKILMTSQDTELNLDTTPCFSDIKSDTWQQQYVCSAKSLGYTRGYDDGTFRPNQSVTTLEALTLIARIESIALDGSGSEAERIRRVFDEQDILASYRYSDAQVITRGVAADVIFRTRELKKGSTPLDSLSVGCERGSGLTSGTKTLSIAGKERRYILALPSEYDPKKAYRVVIALHGRTSSNAQVQNYMWLERGNRDAIIAYPAGLPNGKSFSWSESENIDFIEAIIHEIGQKSCIDREKISAVGHSLGGWFAHKLTCVRAEMFRSMSVVWSYGYQGSCTGRVASLILQRKDDPLSPYSEWVKARDYRRDLYQCDKESTSITIAGNSCQQWSCGDQSPVIWCESYPTYWWDPHSWPTSNAQGIYEFIGSLENK